jgi:hypothetical protein
MTGMYRASAPLALTLLLAACGDDSGSKNSADDNSAAQGAANTPTWYQHVRPIVHEKCGACHRPDAIAPFSLLEYASAKRFAKMMVNAVDEGRMPPFSARETDECKPRNRYANDPRLNEDEKKLLRAWAEGGAPEGDAESPAEAKDPAPVEIARADVVMRLPEPIMVEDTGKGDVHTCLVVDPKIEKDGYVISRQVTSGNPKVLHHVTTYIVRPELADGTPLTRAQLNEKLKAAKGVEVGGRYDCFGGPTLDSTGLGYSLLGSWAPGGGPVTSPADSGQPVKKGSVVVLDMHYHPIPSGPEVDADTEYALQFSDSIPKNIATPIFQGFADAMQKVFDDTMFGTASLIQQPGESKPEFIIPAGAKDHIEEWTFKWKLPQSPLKVYFASSHMHYAGRDLKVSIEHANPQPGEDKLECLEQTPQWDFNWQLGYTWDTDYENLPTIRDGDTVHVRCTYDNVTSNKAIAAALEAQGKKEPIDILVGEDTLDEMCLSLVGISYPNAAYYQQTTSTP